MDIKTGIYKHFKGGYVMVLFTAKHSDRDEIEVVYKGLNNGKYYARPVNSFVEMVENESGESVPRFSLATKEEAKQYIDSQEIRNIYDTFCK